MVRKVKDEAFYHVNRINKKCAAHTHSLFQMGDEYTTDKENVLYNATFNHHSPGNWAKHYEAMMKDLLGQEILTRENIEITASNIKVLVDYLIYYRSIDQEIFLEQIREAQYPNHPSRKFCLWVTKERKEAEKWCNEWSNKDAEKQIVELNLTGIIHVANEEYLFGEDILTLDQMHKKAKNYWSGNPGSMKNEILFCGTAEITAIITPPFD